MVCDLALTRTVMAAIREVFHEEQVSAVPPSSGSEDFGAFGAVDPPIPLCYFRVGGAGLTGLHPPAFLHSGRFLPDAEGVIRCGVRAMSTALFALLEEE